MATIIGTVTPTEDAAIAATEILELSDYTYVCSYDSTRLDESLHGGFTTPEDENEARKIINEILGTSLELWSWKDSGK